MTVPQAVEQSLWDEPPLRPCFGYFTKQDTELGGQRIRKGDGLFLGIAPGNIDPQVRPGPEGEHAGQPLAPRLRRRPARMPRPGHRPRHRRHRRRRAPQATAGRRNSAVEEDELRWTASISSRHLVELPGGVRGGLAAGRHAAARGEHRARPASGLGGRHVGDPRPTLEPRPEVPESEHGSCPRAGAPARRLAALPALVARLLRLLVAGPVVVRGPRPERPSAAVRMPVPVTGSVDSSTRASSWSGRRKSPAGTGPVTTGYSGSPRIGTPNAHVAPAVGASARCWGAAGI